MQSLMDAGYHQQRCDHWSAKGRLPPGHKLVLIWMVCHLSWCLGTYTLHSCTTDRTYQRQLFLGMQCCNQHTAVSAEHTAVKGVEAVMERKVATVLCKLISSLPGGKAFLTLSYWPLSPKLLSIAWMLPTAICVQLAAQVFQSDAGWEGETCFTSRIA